MRKVGIRNQKIIIGICVCIVIGLGCFLWLNRDNNTTAYDESEALEQSEQSPDLSKIPENGSKDELISYQNLQFGFKFDHPDVFTDQEGHTVNLNVREENNLETYKKSIVFNGFIEALDIVFWIEEKPDNFTELELFVKNVAEETAAELKKYNYPSEYTIEPITFEGYRAYKIRGVNEESIYIEASERIFTISYPVVLRNEPIEQIFSNFSILE